MTKLFLTKASSILICFLSTFAMLTFLDCRETITATKEFYPGKCSGILSVYLVDKAMVFYSKKSLYGCENIDVFYTAAVFHAFHIFSCGSSFWFVLGYHKLSLELVQLQRF